MSGRHLFYLFMCESMDWLVGCLDILREPPADQTAGWVGREATTGELSCCYRHNLGNSINGNIFTKITATTECRTSSFLLHLGMVSAAAAAAVVVIPRVLVDVVALCLGYK